MASFMFLFRYVVDAIKGSVAEPQGRRDALFILEHVDNYRNLHTSVAVLSFFVSAGFGVLTFFLIVNSTLWEGINVQAAPLFVSISWVLIFPVLMLFFLFIMSVLDMMGVKDVRSVIRYRLSTLRLSQEQLRELESALASRHWRHGPIFESVVADLIRKRSLHAPQ